MRFPWQSVPMRARRSRPWRWGRRAVSWTRTTAIRHWNRE
jgi:hypothetical protein